MCGIFGIVCDSDKIINNNLLKTYLKDMFYLSSKRGKEASGLAVRYDNEIKILKKGIPYNLFVTSADYIAYIEEILSNFKNQKSISIIGHTRLSTNGSGNFDLNNHPIVANDIVGIHNGIITDYKETNTSFLKDINKSDSEFLFNHINYLSKKHNNDYVRSIEEAYKDLSGSASIAFFIKDKPYLCLATNTGSLYLYQDPSLKTFIFFSEKRALEKFLTKHSFPINNQSMSQISLVKPTIIDLNKAELESGLKKNYHHQKSKKNQQKGLVTVFNSDRKLVRCSKCILPHTYPFINFDDNGVCNYCKNFKNEKLLGQAKFESILNKYRKSDGEHDCIVAFSGGRDSSYGLHLLKKKFRMNPIAYSYDWGMVTDIARRNQARITGQLGIEHIIRTENLIQKRRYLRKNIEAWLRSPHLGMVPLFMAGDKFFFDIGRNLRKELNIPLVIFCAGNELERTDFKSGFAGIRENDHRQRLFSFSMLNKLQLAFFYFYHYIKNPFYLNESFLESLLSFKATFVSRDNFVYLYHYLKWDEEEINTTLIQEYNWETSEKSENTWRIGDGYTEFINYIYSSIAGFSEFDTFRSQQIRKGLIQREEALDLIEADNTPDLGLLKDFANIVGLSFEEVLYKISLIPKLY